MKRKKIEIGDNLMMLLIVVVMVAGIVLGSVVKCKGQGQTDSTETYCLPLWIARQEIENSSKKIEQDSLIVDLNLRLVEKHLAYQGLQEDFAAYRSNAARIQAADRSLSDAMEKQARHWQAEARRRERIWKAGRWLIPVGFGLGVLVGK